MGNDLLGRQRRELDRDDDRAAQAWLRLQPLGDQPVVPQGMGNGGGADVASQCAARLDPELLEEADIWIAVDTGVCTLVDTETTWSLDDLYRGLGVKAFRSDIESRMMKAASKKG